MPTIAQTTRYAFVTKQNGGGTFLAARGDADAG